MMMMPCSNKPRRPLPVLCTLTQSADPDGGAGAKEGGDSHRLRAIFLSKRNDKKQRSS